MQNVDQVKIILDSETIVVFSGAAPCWIQAKQMYKINNTFKFWQTGLLTWNNYFQIKTIKVYLINPSYTHFLKFAKYSWKSDFIKICPLSVVMDRTDCWHFYRKFWLVDSFRSRIQPSLVPMRTKQHSAKRLFTLTALTEGPRHITERAFAKIAGADLEGRTRRTPPVRPYI